LNSNDLLSLYQSIAGHAMLFHYWKPLDAAEACIGVKWMCFVTVPICFVVSGDGSQTIVCVD
jgi:hypothetical protein